MTELMDAVVETLEEIRVTADKSWHRELTTKANGLYHSIMNFQFSVGSNRDQEDFGLHQGYDCEAAEPQY